MQALGEGGVGGEVELLLGPAGVDPRRELAVGLGRVPPRLALVADQLDHDARPGADGQLVVGAQVHGVAAVVVLGGQHDGLGRVVDEASSRLAAPVPHTSIWSSPASLASTSRFMSAEDDVGDRRSGTCRPGRRGCWWA